MPDPGLCTRLLTPVRLLELVMRRSLAPPQLRCFQDGVELHPNRYLGSSTTRRGQTVSTASMRRVGQLLDSGCTLVLDGVDAFDPTLEVACRELQWWSCELVQANVYLTTRETAGFQLHWDDHDVVVVQLAGSKTWEVRGRTRRWPMYRDADTEQEPSDEIVWTGTLKPGDVVHVPRGHWHQATRAGLDDGFSLHATFGFVKRTVADWLAWVADHAREDELFRRDLDRPGTTVEAGVEDDRLVDAALRVVAARPPSQFLAARTAERPPHRHVITRGVFGVPDAVVCVTEFPPTVEHRDGAVEVRTAGKKITFAGKAAPALAVLLSGRPVAIHEASESTGLDVARLADVLVQEEICAELTPELSSAYTALAMTGACSKPR